MITRKILLILLFGSFLSTMGLAQHVYNNDAGAGDRFYSNLNNWRLSGVVPSSLPGLSDYAQLNGTPLLDTDETVGQIISVVLSAGLDDDGGSLSITGLTDDYLIRQNKDDGEFVLDAEIIINAANFKTMEVDGANGALTFGEHSKLTLNTITDVKTVSTGVVNMNGALLAGASNLRVSGDSKLVFGSTSDNSAFNRDMVIVGDNAMIVANTADNGVFMPISRKLQVNNTGGTLELNGKNIYQGNLVVGGSNTLRVEVNKDQNTIQNTILNSSSLTIAIGPEVQLIYFAGTKNWGTANITIENFKNGVLRFGTDASALTSGQLSQINIGGGAVYLDANGYLIESGSPVYSSSSWSAIPTSSDNAIIAGNYSAGSLEVNDLLIEEGAQFTVGEGETLTVNGDLLIKGDLTINNGGELIVTGNILGEVNQTIDFPTPVPVAFGDADFDLGATASSGLPVTYTSLDESVVTISGSTVSIVGAGSVEIVASQAGDATYNAAPDFTQTLMVNKADQTITFDALADVTEGDAAFDLTATASSGLDVTYTSSNPEVATISGSTVTIVGAGTTDITASQTGNANWNAAVDVVQTLTVLPGGEPLVNPKPTNVTATAIGTDVTVSWEDNSDVELGYRISLNINGNGWFDVLDVNSDITESTFNGLQPGRTYAYRVRSIGGSNVLFSNWSNITSVTITEAVQLEAPTNLTVTVVGTEATLMWEDNSNVEDGYQIQWNKEGFGWADGLLTGSDAVSGVFSNMQGGKSYSFRVKAVSSSLFDSEWSNVVVTTPTEVVQLEAPTNLTVTVVGREATLIWEDNSNVEDGYQIQWNKEGFGWADGSLTGSDAVSGVFSNMQGGKSYSFRVKAVSSSLFDSDWSND